MATSLTLSSAVSAVRPSQDINSMGSLEMSFQKCGSAGPERTNHGWLPSRVNQALWAAFPEATSENDLAESAAPYFRNKRTGEQIDPRTVRLWLRGSSIPQGEHMMALIYMVGADFFRLPRTGVRQ